MISAKFFLVLVLFFIAAAIHVDATYVGACAEVCGRINRERDACCKAHGYNGMRSACADCY